MARLEILTEEESMAEFLKGILPRLLPPQYALGQNCAIHPHNGKDDLQKSIPRKMRGYRRDVKVLIIHDQDHHNDCKALKQRLRQLAGDRLPVLIRIACRELENWYLGDFPAIDLAYPNARALRHRNKAIYRTPDNPQGATEMEKLVREFAKTDAAQRLPQHMTIAANTSPSFNHLVTGLQKFLQ